MMISFIGGEATAGALHVPIICGSRVRGDRGEDAVEFDSYRASAQTIISVG